MADINNVVLVGRLTRDAELKFTASGTAVCRLSLAINRRIKKGDQWEDEANFFDVVLWGKQGETLSQYLVKGKQIAVNGELRQNSWEQDGQKRSKVEVHANNIQLLGGSTGPTQAGDNRGSATYSDRSRTDSYSPSSDIPDDGFDDDIPF